MKFSNEGGDNNAEEAGGDDSKQDSEPDSETLPEDAFPEVSSQADDESRTSAEEDGGKQFFANADQYTLPRDVSLKEDLESKGH